MVKDIKKVDTIRILHVVGRMDRGGTEALLMSLLRKLDRETVIFDFVEQTNDVCHYDEEILQLGGKIFRCPTLSISNIGAYKKWWKEFLAKHPEYYIIHGHSRGSAPVYLTIAKKMGRRTIAHCHNNSNGKGIKAVVRYIWQYPLRYIPEYCFACSEDSGYSQFGHHREFTVILNGIQTEKYIWNPSVREQVRKQLGLENAFVVGNVARFIEQKNHEFLIDIFYELKKKLPQAKLMLIGCGEKEQRIKDKVNKLNLSDSVLFMGVRQDVCDLMQAMDVFLLPSCFEGLGIVNIEAQAAGLPCFVSDKVVPKEIQITDLVHFISLRKKAEYWSDQIVTLQKCPFVRRDTSQEIIKAGFDIEYTKKYLMNFYMSLLNGGECDAE